MIINIAGGNSANYPNNNFNHQNIATTTVKSRLLNNQSTDMTDSQKQLLSAKR